MLTEVWKKMYNIIPYKLKVMHAEENMLNLSPIRQKMNFYPRKENNCGDEYSMVILDDKHLGDTIIARSTYFRGNRILESIGFVLYYLHIGLHNGD